MKKTVAAFGATGTAGCACIDELIRQGMFNVRVIVRRSGQQEKSSSGVVRSDDEKHGLHDRWKAAGADIRTADATNQMELIPALRGTD